MATTTPDNLWSPDGGDAYALTTDLAAMQDTVQEAFNESVHSRNQQYYDIAATRTTITGMKRGDTFQESDGDHILWVYDGTDWARTPGSFIRLIASAQQTMTTGTQFISWAAPGVGGSINQGGDTLFTVSGGVITIVKAGVYDISFAVLVQTGTGSNVSSLRLGGTGGAILSQNFINLSSNYGSQISHRVDNVQVASGTTVNIVNDVGVAVNWAVGANGTTYNNGYITITYKQSLT